MGRLIGSLFIYRVPSPPSLDHFGCLWELLGDSGGQFGPPGGALDVLLWEVLGGSRRLWEALGGSRRGSWRLQKAPGDSGRLEEALGGSGKRKVKFVIVKN